MVKELDDISQVVRRNCQIFAGVSGNLFSKEADYQNILAPFQSIMHVNLHFSCARPSLKISLKDYMN